jgi:hypothetical protein
MNPPGRFLKQDPVTQLWNDIGTKQALAKTRQALREGAPEMLMDLKTAKQIQQTLFQDTVRSNTNGGGGGSNTNSVADISNASDEVKAALSNYLPDSESRSGSVASSDSLLSLGSCRNGTFQFSGFNRNQVPASISASSSNSSKTGENAQFDPFVGQLGMPSNQNQTNNCWQQYPSALQSNIQVPSMLQFANNNLNQTSTVHQTNNTYGNQPNLPGSSIHRVSFDAFGNNTAENAQISSTNHQNGNHTSNALLALLSSINQSNSIIHTNTMNQEVVVSEPETCVHSSLLQQLQSQQAYQQLLSQLGLSSNATCGNGHSDGMGFSSNTMARSA